MNDSDEDPRSANSVQEDGELRTHPLSAGADDLALSLSSDDDPDFVVGIGASAGGLEALEGMFENMPTDTGMSFVIVQHLSPDHKSLMDELLARKTYIPIQVAVDGMRIERNQIYLLPPNQEMIVANKKLYLTERDKSSVVNLPINTFLRSMSENYQESCIAIILSGTGSDGTKGVTAVHDNGGFVIAQEPGTCKFDSMPVSALATGKVDLVLAPNMMPGALLKYSKRTEKVRRQLAVPDLDAEENKFSEILILLNNRFDLDFSQYKPSTITRRLERRLFVQKVGSLNEYLGVLLANADELEALYFDLLIGVTEFFRDKQAFESLRFSVAKLLDELPPEEELRVWTLGCATGQEAYSLSIILLEEIKKSKSPARKYKIFATDIHRKSLAVASAGIYPKDLLGGVSKEQLEKYFQPINGGDRYQVKTEIRSPILFAPQNILKDPPFTKLHLVTCRNVLIYFNTKAQQRVLSLLTFALGRRGLLFLGPSESLGRHANDYEQVDQSNRILRKLRDAAKRPALDLVPRRVARNPAITGGIDTYTTASVKSKRAVEVLLQKFVPASVLMDTDGTVLHVFGDVGKFLSMDAGVASLNIRSMVGQEAKNKISHMLIHIAKNRNSVSSSAVGGFANFESVDVTMQPLSDSPSDLDYILASFRETPEDDVRIQELGRNLGAHDLERIDELEEELNFARESLQTTVEELESSNEELQASNEELMASNEELQSTNEELHSVNEELYSVNSEYQEKEREKRELEQDEQSIFATHGMGVMFIDSDLRLRKFSAVAGRIFGVITADTGRPISAISSQPLRELVEPVSMICNGEVDFIERELVTDSGNVFTTRISANDFAADAQGKIENNQPKEEETGPTRGAVLTLAETTKQSRSLEETSKREKRLQNILNAVTDGYFEWNAKTGEAFFSRGLLQTLGYEGETPTWRDLLGDSFEEFEQLLQTLSEKENSNDAVLAFVKADGSKSWKICKVHSGGDEQQNPETFVGIVVDFDEHKALEERLNAQTKDLERSNQLLEQFAYIVSHDLKAPLRHVQINLQFLKEDLEAGELPKVSGSISEIENHVSRLNSLIEDIITYSRVTSEARVFEQVDLNVVLDEAIEISEHLIAEKNVKIKREKLPVIEGDSTLLAQLFQNLLGNACKYNNKNNPKVQITAKVHEKECEIAIKDNGIGFDEEYKKKLFAPFKRLVTHAEFEGTGIGLAICKIVVEQHRGTIDVTSALGKGSVFTFKLPLHQSDN